MDGTTVLGTASQTASPYLFTAANLGVGSHTLTAVYSGDARSLTSTSNSITIQVIVPTPQTITFAPLPNVPVATAPFTLTATSDSGLTVAYTSNTPAVCSISGATLTILISGGCTITATQPGSTLYTAAAPVTRSFTILFSDVSSADFDYAEITTFTQIGITNGCGSNNFCPNDNVTRDEMAIFIVRAIYGGDNFTYTATPYFTDVQPATFGFKWIQKLRDLGMTSGCTATTYCPGDVVPRSDGDPHHSRTPRRESGRTHPGVYLSLHAVFHRRDSRQRIRVPVDTTHEAREHHQRLHRPPTVRPVP